MNPNMVDAGFHVYRISSRDPVRRRRSGLAQVPNCGATVARHLALEEGENAIQYVDRFRCSADFATPKYRQQLTIDQVGRRDAGQSQYQSVFRQRHEFRRVTSGDRHRIRKSGLFRYALIETGDGGRLCNNAARMSRPHRTSAPPDLLPSKH